MKPETIEKILNFLEEKEGKGLPKKWFELIKRLKFINELENYPDGTQYRYEGDLELSETNITKLPNDLYVDGELFLDNCKQLTKLPNDLYVVGSLDLENCKQLTKLPDNLYVGGYLSLYECEQLTKLPDNLYVGGKLYLNETNITELPDNLYVGKDLYITNTPLSDKYTHEEIYEMVKLRGGEIKWDIYS